MFNKYIIYTFVKQSKYTTLIKRLSSERNNTKIVKLNEFR